MIHWVNNKDSLRKNIREYQKAKGNSSFNTSWVRHWYYDSESDMVGPAKFVAVDDITTPRYLAARQDYSGGPAQDWLERQGWCRLLHSPSRDYDMARGKARAFGPVHEHAVFWSVDC